MHYLTVKRKEKNVIEQKHAEHLLPRLKAIFNAILCRYEDAIDCLVFFLENKGDKVILVVRLFFFYIKVVFRCHGKLTHEEGRYAFSAPCIERQRK